MKLRSLLLLTATCSASLATVAVPSAPPKVTDQPRSGTFPAVGGNPAAGDTPVAFYATPDATKPALLYISASDASIASSTPVMDAAKVVEGWRIAVLPGPFRGYVASKMSHKDMSITPGTAVHIAPDENSPILGAVPASPVLMIKSPGIDWSEVSFPGPATFYFKSIAPKPVTPAVAATVAAAPVPALTPAPTPAPAVNLPPTRLNTLPPVTTAVTAGPATTKADPADVAHYYYGMLKQRTDLNLGGPTNAQYVLYSEKNQVIALVDLNDVVLPSPLVNYLNKPAKIYGTAYTDSSLPFAVIHAATLQSN